MFNPANLANEVFGILRSFDYKVNIFDYDGNRVYEPSDARRFFASPKNITVSIHEDGENSGIRMFLSKNIDISEVEGLISTMRATASKFGLLFNVRKYERELKPKDLAPNGASDFDAGISLANAVEQKPSGEKIQPESSPTEPKSKPVKPQGNKLDQITKEVSRLTKSFKEIANHLNGKPVKESYMPINESETLHIKALDMDVEKSAWDDFLNGILHTDVDVPVVSSETIKKFVDDHFTDGLDIDPEIASRATHLNEIVKATKTTTPLFSDALDHCLDLYLSGNPSRIVDIIVQRVLDCRVEATPVNEGLIMTESIKEFGQWFDGMSSTKIFEAGSYDDGGENAVDLAWKTTKENFDPEVFLDDVGTKDFGWGDDTFSHDDKHITRHALKKSLIHYLDGELSQSLEDEYPNDREIDELADDLLSDVITVMENDNWTIDDKLEEASDDLTTDDVVLPSRADNDLTNEITAHHNNDDEMNRIVSLARGSQSGYRQ